MSLAKSRARSNSSSSNAPSSPGPSISIRTTRSSTPTPGLSPTSSYTNVRSHGKGPQYGSGTSGIGMGGRERSATQMSSSTVGTSATRPAHTRQRPTLMGRGSSSRLGRNQLALNNASITPAVPPILINGNEPPEDVDVAAIGRLSSGPEDQQPYASTFRTTPESTAAGVDSLFMRFGVKEVKAIANRGRVKAEGKREELRTMVGERYRDLISAADSIVRMRKSSNALTNKLSTARDECDRDIMVARAADEDLTRSRMLSRAATPYANGHTPYSIATLVKLLLDCPEHIWRAIEREDYLSAARLEGIGRAVYRELVSSGKRKATADDDMEEDDEDSGLLAAFPLMEQQWETLDQLGPQISLRANQHLQTWDVSARTISESLAAIILLDNKSLKEVLHATLESRKQTLQSIFESANAFVLAPTPRRPSNNLLSSPIQATASQISAANKDVENAVKKAKEAFGLAMATHSHIDAIFVSPNDKAGDSSPQLLRLLHALQEPASSATPSSTNDNHTLPSIFAALPNSHLFLRYLPPQIMQYSPSLDETLATSNSLSKEEVGDALSQWFTDFQSSITNGINKLLSSLTSAKQLASVRSSLYAFLDKQAQEDNKKAWQGQRNTLQKILEGALRARFTQIYRLRLERVSQTVRESLQAGLRALADSKEDQDPILFLFSQSIPFPSTSTLFTPLPASVLQKALPQEPIEPFELFRIAMNKRISGRSPVLDTCLNEIEGIAREVREDLDIWLHGAEESGDATNEEKSAYLAAAEEALQQSQAALNDTLNSVNQVHERLFIGSLALHLACDSTFIGNLTLQDSRESIDDDNLIRKALLEIDIESTQQWRESTIAAVLSQAQSNLKEALANPAPLNTSQPSSCVASMLETLLKSIRQIGPYRSQQSSFLVSCLLQDLRQRLQENVLPQHIQALRELSKAQRSAFVSQTQTDLACLKEVLQWGISQEAEESLWSDAFEQLAELATPSDQLAELSLQAFQRSQNLLAPLLPTTYQQPDPSDTSRLLPYGQSTGATAADTKLGLSKPGPRFTLLPLNATAA